MFFKYRNWIYLFFYQRLQGAGFSRKGTSLSRNINRVVWLWCIKIPGMLPTVETPSCQPREYCSNISHSYFIFLRWMRRIFVIVIYSFILSHMDLSFSGHKRCISIVSSIPHNLTRIIHYLVHWFLFLPNRALTL